jgi:hypothetical protein
MDSAAGPNAYYNTAHVVAEVSQNRHRELVGGMWDDIGKLQFDFLRAQGLTPSAKLIDIGCGCLRGGVYFVDFLEPGNYYGVDISEELLNVGYDVELKSRGLQHKLPRANLVADGEFQFAKFSAAFDFGFAQSLFSHLPAGLVRQCLSRLAPNMAPRGRLFGTFFIVPDDHPAGAPCGRPHGIQTFDHKDPYHYRVAQIESLCEGLAWRPLVIGDWGHPRDQQMVLFHSVA